MLVLHKNEERERCLPAPRKLMLGQAAVERSQGIQRLADGIFVQAQASSGRCQVENSLGPSVQNARPATWAARLSPGARLPLAIAARSLPAGGTPSGPTCFPAPVLLPAPAHNLSRSQAGAAAMELSRPAWKPVRARAQPKQTMPGPRRNAFAPHAPAHGCAALREEPGTRVLQERLLRLSQDRRSSPRTANAAPCVLTVTHTAGGPARDNAPSVAPIPAPRASRGGAQI